MTGVGTERAIVADARADGQAVDWERAYALHAAEILRYLRRLSRDASNAEDLMQETFVRAERAARVPADAELRPWLYRIATNLAIDHLRRGRRIAFMPFSGREPDERAAFDDSGDAVRHALRAIPAEQAVTLILRLHEGYSRAEIARLTGVSERAVKVRLEHGRESFARAYRRERDHR